MTVAVERPLPAPTLLTEPFWTAARNHILVRPVCDDCGGSFVTPQVICPHCLSECWTYQESSGLGTVYSATVVHRSPSPALSAPYELAIVDLDEGWHMLANIVDNGAGPIQIGTAVEVTWVVIDEHWTFPAFRPINAKEWR